MKIEKYKVPTFDDYVKEAYVTKEKMKEVQKEIKSTFPEYKFSIRREHSSRIRISILSGPLQLTDNPDGHESISYGHLREIKDKPEVNAFFEKIFEIANRGNYDRSDLMTDYFDVGFYLYIEVGQWDKPYVCTNKTLIKPVSEKVVYSFKEFKNNK